MDQQKITDEQQSNPLPDGVVEITAQEFDSVYEQVVRPDRAVYLPGYFRRWLRALGPDLAWMYVAYRQAAYSAGGRKDNVSNRFSGEIIAGLCGVTGRTYWNRLVNPNTWRKLNGLVKIVDAGKEWNKKSPTPKQLPRRYTVAMTLPLTPADTTSLRKWLMKNLETSGGPEAVLRAAIAVPLDELIPEEAEDQGEPMTVRKLARDLFQDLDGKLLDSLASALQNHIMAASDLIKVTLFFLEHVLPHLGAGPAWMLTLLRDQCFTDTKTGEVRNRVTVQDGYDEIAGWMGMSGNRRARTIWDWLNEKNPAKHTDAGKYQNAVLQVYLREVSKDEPQFDFECQPRAFDVLLEDVPQELIQMALTGAGETAEVRWRHFQSGNDATFSLGMTRFSVSIDAIFSQAMTRFSVSIDATFSQAMTRLSYPDDATFTVLALNSLKPTLNSSAAELNRDAAEKSEPGAPNAEAPAQAKPAAAVDSDWDLQKLLDLNHVHPKTQKDLRGHKVTAHVFVAYLLFAFSRENSKVKYPLSFALDQARANPNPPDEKFSALAAMPADTLVAFLTGAAPGDHPLTPAWRKLMGSDGGKTPRYRELLPILLGDKAPTPEELRERKRAAPRKKTELELALENFVPRKG